jgi:hypothetical protein
MNAEDDDPIPQDQDKAKKLEAEHVEWNTNALLGAFEKYGNTKAPWADRARSALSATAVSVTLKGYRGRLAQELSELRLRVAVDAGCDDPQVRYFYVKTLPRTPETVREMKQLADRFDADKFPAFRRLHSRWNACANAAEEVPAAKPELKPSPTNRRGIQPRADTVAMFEAVWPAFADLAAVHDSESDRSLYEIAELVFRVYDGSGHDRREAYDRVMKAVEAGGGSVWLRKVIEGNFYVEYAWDARGNGFGSEVPAEGWPVFRDRLQKAEAALNAAWEADPTRPEPCVRFLALALGLGHDRPEMEMWFRRAMTADPNCLDAVRTKLEYLRPKWHGSVEEVRAFGRQCARTRNWDAGLLYVFLETLNDNERVVLDSTQFQKPGVWVEVRELFEPHLMQRPDDRFARTHYARICSAAGQYESAYYHFAKLNGNPLIAPGIIFGDMHEFQQAYEWAQRMYAAQLSKK